MFSKKIKNIMTTIKTLQLPTFVIPFNLKMTLLVIGIITGGVLLVAGLGPVFGYDPHYILHTIVQ